MTALMCPICGAPVPPSKGTTPRKYCSKVCTDKAAYEFRIERGYRRHKSEQVSLERDRKRRLAKRDLDHAESPYAARVTVDCVRTTDGRTLVVETRGQRCIGWRSAGHVSHS